MIHESHWERLASLAPDDVSHRTGARHDPDPSRYELPLLNRRVLVDPGRRTVMWGDEGRGADERPGHDVTLLSVVYLNQALDIGAAGDWVPAESLPSGAFFFRGFHAIPTAQVAARFDGDAESFLQAGRDLDGAPVGWGDACIELRVLPRIPSRIVLWLGDEEFRSRANMLFDRLVDQHMPLDALLSLARYVTTALVEAADGALPHD
jgi:hypothetical protein